ncbi:MAG: glycosyl transferase [Gammaproteobacteria bacterium]|nr:glycosyl transferase [Gammaproteobacteria bacterium]|tara:strand:+ start:3505 stop:4536 length:1032 start_codon:yes stop_codon:yes gene_type:complete
MRVAQIMAGQEIGGAELFYARLTSALADSADVSQMAILRPHKRWLDVLLAAGVPAYTYRFGGRLDVQTRRGLRRHLEVFEADVALNWMSRAARFCPEGAWTNAARLGGYYSLKYYRNCQAFIGNTQGICTYLRQQGVAAGRVHYIPNFIDERPLPADNAVQFPVAKRDDEAVLLAAGRLHRNKGFDVLIEALTSIPSATLWLAGEGPEQGNLALLAERLGVRDRVEFLGWQDDLRPYLGRADVFVCSSRIEPLGNVVLEAWRHGCPLVAARAAGPVELITDGLNGSLCELEDAPDMAKAIMNLLNSASQRQHYVAAGREAYAAGFSRAQVTARYLQFFEEIKP